MQVLPAITKIKCSVYSYNKLGIAYKEKGQDWDHNTCHDALSNFDCEVWLDDFFQTVSTLFTADTKK